MRKNILVSLALFSLIMLYSGITVTTPISGKIVNNQVSVPSDYEVHDSILITSDADFITQGWPGNGTESEPYIIENLFITQTVVSQTSIEIRDTTACFIIQNCYLFTVFADDPYTGDCVGILTSSCSENITIRNNTVIGYQFGIWTHSCDSTVLIDSNYLFQSYFTIAPYYNNDNVTIINNEFQDCMYAVYEIGNNPATVSILDNTAYNTEYRAIYCQDSNQTLIQNNTIINGGEGISLQAFCYNVTVVNNTIENTSREPLFIEFRSANNTIIWNNLSSITYQSAVDDGEDNTFDKNYWGNYDGYDLNNDGYGDDPFPIQGSAGSIDYNPRGPFCTLIVLDWHGGTWLDDTTFQQSALFGVDCQYYVYSPAIIHTDLQSTFTGESGNISAGESTITIHVPDQFWGASIYFNTSNPTLDTTWYDCLKIGYSATGVWQNGTTIGKSMRFDCRTFWTFLIDGIERESGIVNDSRWSQEYLQFYFEKDLTVGEHTFSFLGKFEIDAEYYHEFASGTYTIVPPEIDMIADIEYQFDSLGNSITWNPYDEIPESYEVRRDGILVETDVWDGTSITVNIDGLAIGVYEYEMTVKNLAGLTANDTVLVTVSDNSPLLGSPDDIFYVEGTPDQSIFWIASDANPDSYVVFLNSSIYIASSWNGATITVNVEGLRAGIYNLTIVVTDTSGNSATDTVIVTVTEAVIPTTTIVVTTNTTIIIPITDSNTTSSTTSTGLGDYSILVYIISIGSSIIIVVVVILIFTKSRT